MSEHPLVETKLFRDLAAVRFKTDGDLSPGQVCDLEAVGRFYGAEVNIGRRGGLLRPIPVSKVTSAARIVCRVLTGEVHG